MSKISKEKQLDLIFDLINAFSITKSSIDTAMFLQDIMTAKEISNLSKRLRIAKLLQVGETQRDIAFELRCSLATVTKVKAWLDQRGDGFKNVLTKLPKRYQMPKKLPRGPIEYHIPQAIFALTQHELAKSQQKQINKFTESIESKKAQDKDLQKVFDEKYRSKKNVTV